MNTKPSNKGRICRVDQAWSAALREDAEREKLAQSAVIGEAQVIEVTVTELDDDEGEAVADVGDCDDSPCRHNVVPFVHAGEVVDENAPADDGEDLSQAFAPPEQPDELPIVPPTPPTPGEQIVVPVALLSTALLTAAQGDVRYYLNGVFVHAVDGEIRIVATDGHRLIVSRLDLDGAPCPAWSAKGVIIPADELRQALPLLARNGALPSSGWHRESKGDGGSIIIEYGPGHPRVTLRSFNGFASFSLTPVAGEYPNYARVLAAQGATLARNEGEALRATAIDTRYMRSVAEIAAKLGARSVHPFIGADDNQAAFFTFDGAPDTVLIVMGVRTDEHVSPAVIRMVGRDGIAASISAFRAHLTRTTKALAAPNVGPSERQELEARRAMFEGKIVSLTELTAPRLENKSRAA